MRVAHIITRMIIGGAQENTLYNCQDLMDDFGDEVLLITGPTTGPEGQLLEQGRAGSIRVHQIDRLLRPIHPLRDWQAYKELLAALKDFDPDVVHTHSAKGGFLGRHAAWRYQVPLVVHTVHGAPFHPYQSALARRLFIALEKRAARRCHHMISVADAMTDLMVEARVARREKFTTIYSGMDVKPFQASHQLRDAARRELGFSDSDVVFGKIARLFHLKGHEYLIEAAREIATQDSNCRFLLVGDGILRDEFLKRITELGLRDKFVLTGLVPPEKIPFYLSAMDALVHTSLREGLARTLPQALISGKPVISYDVDGAREVVIDGETGFLLPPKSISDIATAALRLSADANLRRRLGQEGARRFTEQFCHKHMSRQIRGLYTKLLTEAPPSIKN